jgi:hypothetical protein
MAIIVSKIIEMNSVAKAQTRKVLQLINNKKNHEILWKNMIFW